MVQTTRAQRETLVRLWRRRHGMTGGSLGTRESYLSFRRRVQPGLGWIAVVMPEGLYIGIEPDGHAHS